MIIGAEIGLLIMGLIAIVTGRLPVGPGRVVRGAPARYLGVVALLPFPVAFGIGFGLGYILALQGVVLQKETWNVIGIAIEVPLLAMFVGLITTLGRKLSEEEAVAAKPAGLDPDFASGRRRQAPDAAGAEPGSGAVPDWWHEADAPSSGKARLSLIFGLGSLALTLFASIPAFVLGVSSLVDIKNSGGRIRGKGTAIAGVILGAIGSVSGLFVLSLLLPFLQKEPGGGGPPVVAAPVPAFQPGQPQVQRKRQRPPQPVLGAAPEIARGPAPDVAAPAPRVVEARKNRFEASDAAAAFAIATRPEAPRTPLGSDPRRVRDAAVTTLKVEAKAVVPCAFWSHDGRAFFVLEGEAGLLRRVATEGLVEERRWEVGRPCTWISPSAEGLLLAVGEREVWVLDPATFAVRKQIAAPTARVVASAPSLSVAFVTGKRPDALGVIDLKAGKVVREYDPRSFPEQPNVGYNHLVVTPDGKFVFSEGMERLLRFAVKGDELEFGEASPRIAQNGRRIDVSPDSSLVALPSGGGNYEAGPYTTNVYKVADLATPEVKIASGAYPQALGFDPKAGKIYAQNNADPLIVFGMGGVKESSYKLAARGSSDSPRQFAVHPDGRKLLASSSSALWYVDLAAGPAPAGAAAADRDEPAPAAKKTRKTAPKMVPKTAPKKPSRP